MGKFSCISGGLDHFFDEKITGRKTGSDTAFVEQGFAVRSAKPGPACIGFHNRHQQSGHCVSFDCTHPLMAMSCPCCGAGAVSFTAKLGSGLDCSRLGPISGRSLKT
jgi:hypothetical protein